MGAAGNLASSWFTRHHFLLKPNPEPNPIKVFSLKNWAGSWFCKNFDLEFPYNIYGIAKSRVNLFWKVFLGSNLEWLFKRVKGVINRVFKKAQRPLLPNNNNSGRFHFLAPNKTSQSGAALDRLTSAETDRPHGCSASKQGITFDKIVVFWIGRLPKKDV